MLHPWPQVFGYVEDEMDGARGPITSMWSKQFYETEPSRDFVRGYTLQFGRGAGPATEAHNRVTLDSDLKDSNGIPAPRIDYTITENRCWMADIGWKADIDMLSTPPVRIPIG